MPPGSCTNSCFAIALGAAFVVACMPIQAVDSPIVLIVDAQITGSGLNYDDICFWGNPGRPQDTLMFVTAKDVPAVEVFRLETGELVRTIKGFVRPNNCDVVDDLLVTADSDGRKVVIHRIPDFQVVAVLDQGFDDPQGVTLLRFEGRRLAFIADRAQRDVHVYDLEAMRLVRVFATGFESAEGMVADELYERVYVADGKRGRVRAFSVSGELLTEFGDEVIQGDAEGIGLYRCATGGWLIVSDQREHSPEPAEFEVFDRKSLAHLGTFTMMNAEGDVTNATDGVDVFQMPTPRFPAGVFAACDDCSRTGDDIDLVSWDRVATELGLEVCPDAGSPLAQ